MSEAEARLEAQRRWGSLAVARISPATQECCVGSQSRYYGVGLSWDEAFADADRRQKAGAA